MLQQRQPRRGVTLVECAIIYPLTLLLVLAIIIGGLGMFRYQEVASLAREGARYASVRGAKYAQTVAGATAANPSRGRSSQSWTARTTSSGSGRKT